MAAHDIGAQMRAQTFLLRPTSVGLRPEAGPIWGVVMDVVTADTDWYALVVLADGSTSLYTSGLLGIIGGGAHETVREAAGLLWQVATARLEAFPAVTDTALPAPGLTALRLLTFDGQRAVVGAALGESAYEVAAVFHAAHEVLGRLRLVTQSGHP